MPARTQAPIADPTPGALSPKKAAIYLDTTEGTLNQWRVRREGPPFLKIGSKVLYRVSALDKYLEDQEKATMAQPERR